VGTCTPILVSLWRPFLWWSHIRLTSQPSVTPWVLRLCRVLAVWRYHTWISRTCLSLYESNGRDRCWLVVNEGFISGPRRSQSFVGRGRRTPAAGFVRRETRAARRVFVPSARESTVTTREGAKEAPLLLLRAQARTLYVHSCARWRSRARAGEGALPLGPPSNFLFFLCSVALPAAADVGGWRGSPRQGAGWERGSFTARGEGAQRHGPPERPTSTG